MFGLLPFFRRATAPRKRTPVCLAIESLESRLCLDGGMTFQAQVLAGHQVQLVGHIDAPNPESFSITIGGSVTGVATPDATGNFTFTTGDASLGFVYALASNVSGEAHCATAWVGVATPSMMFDVSYATPTTAQISGMVLGLDAAQQMVTLTGSAFSAPQEVSVNADGTFTWIVDVQPGATISGVTTDLWGQSSNVWEATVGFPASLSVNTTVLPNHEVQVTGWVSGPFAAHATVQFSGAVSGSVVADEFGYYAFSTPSALLGEFYVSAQVENQTISSPICSSVVVAAPCVSLTIESQTETTVTICGSLSSLDNAEKNLDLWGVSLTSVTTDSAGKFSFTIDRTELSTLQVSATDFWGQTSNFATASVAAAPLIVEFEAVRNTTSQLWTFSGRVQGEGIEGKVVTLGGLASLLGQTATVNADGTFTYSTFLTQGEFGAASAQILNPTGIDSNIAYAEVAES